MNQQQKYMKKYNKVCTSGCEIQRNIWCNKRARSKIIGLNPYEKIMKIIIMCKIEIKMKLSKLKTIYMQSD